MRTLKHGAVLVCLLLGAATAWADEAKEQADPAVHTEVKRDKTKAPKHGSLTFLRDNRVFLRGQLDRLSLLTTLTDQGRAQLIDDRMLRLQELARAIAAARDTVDVEAAATARRELLDSVTQLGELENQLVLMESLLIDQRARLTVLEDDFLGHQETALVILVRGLPEEDMPDGLVLTEGNRVLDVPLSAAEKASLRQGGVAQIYHRFVEPRDHLFTLGFAGQGWADLPAVEVPVTADRDRITFLELDLSRLAPDPAQSGQELGLMAKVWVR